MAKVKKKKAKTSSSRSKPNRAERKKLALARKAKLKANKGDGSFPDRLVVTRERTEKNAEGKSKSWFLGHKEDLTTLYEDGTVVAVYKLVRVSSLIVKRKIALNRS